MVEKYSLHFGVSSEKEFHTRRKPVKTEPTNKYMLELQKQMGKINSRFVSTLSPPSISSSLPPSLYQQDILFPFVQLTSSTQFSYAPIHFLTTSKMCFSDKTLLLTNQDFVIVCSSLFFITVEVIST